jgi:hypothetical protein
MLHLDWNIREAPEKGSAIYPLKEIRLTDEFLAEQESVIDPLFASLHEGAGKRGSRFRTKRWRDRDVGKSSDNPGFMLAAFRPEELQVLGGRHLECGIAMRIEEHAMVAASEVRDGCGGQHGTTSILTPGRKATLREHSHTNANSRTPAFMTEEESWPQSDCASSS